MPNLLCLSTRCLIGVMLISLSAIADAPKPSQEFWEYIAEYGDDNGNVLDPLEYDQILSMKESDVSQIKNTDFTKEKISGDKPDSKNSRVKVEQKSSAQTTSADAKGAKL